MEPKLKRDRRQPPTCIAPRHSSQGVGLRPAPDSPLLPPGSGLAFAELWAPPLVRPHRVSASTRPRPAPAAPRAPPLSGLDRVPPPLLAQFPSGLVPNTRTASVPVMPRPALATPRAPPLSGHVPVPLPPHRPAFPQSGCVLTTWTSQLQSYRAPPHRSTSFAPLELRLMPRPHCSTGSAPSGLLSRPRPGCSSSSAPSGLLRQAPPLMPLSPRLHQAESYRR